MDEWLTGQTSLSILVKVFALFVSRSPVPYTTQIHPPDLGFDDLELVYGDCKRECVLYMYNVYVHVPFSPEQASTIYFICVHVLDFTGLS